MPLKPLTPRLPALIFGMALAVPVLVAAAPDQAPAPAPAKAPDATPAGPNTKLDLPGVPNVYQWTDKIISGACPEGDAGFKALAEHGVKTIITVDGAFPDVDLALKYGMRYVHIPVEYSGITQEEALNIVRAVRDLPGPIFIHCHHGKHRSPAAAALAAIALSGFDNAKAEAALKQAGTGVNYKGLWANAHNFKKPTDAELNKADNNFPAKAKLEGLAEQMVHVDNRWDTLNAVKAVNWGVPANDPDTDPPHEALLLREAFAESARTDLAKKFPADFLKQMAAAETAAGALEDALRAKDSVKAQMAFDVVKASCTSCHAVYRDVKPAG